MHALIMHALMIQHGGLWLCDCAHWAQLAMLWRQGEAERAWQGRVGGRGALRLTGKEPVRMHNAEAPLPSLPHFVGRAVERDHVCGSP